MTKLNIYGTIIAKNEEDFIEVPLSGMQWMNQVFLVDDGSTDSTVKIAKKFSNVTVISASKLTRNFDRPTHSVADLRNLSINLIDEKDYWIYFSDADEYITDELKHEIKSALLGTFDAFQIPRLNYFLGRPLKYGGWYPDYQIRLIKKSALVEWVHGPLDLPPVIKENKFGYLLKAKNGPHDKPLLRSTANVGKLKKPYYHFNHRNITEMINKMNRFYNSEIDFLRESGSLTKPSVFSYIYVPLKFFIKSYIFKKGFLDGVPGLIEAIFQSFSYFVFEVRKWEATLNPNLEKIYSRYKKLCTENRKF